MTQDELNALPEVSGGGYSRVEKIIDGKRVFVAKQEPAVSLLMVADNEVCYVRDANGIKWMIGYHNGEKVKQRCMSQDTYTP